MSVATAGLNLLSAGDCVAIVFPSGARKLACVELALPTAIRCWGYPFRSPEYAWTDESTGETLRLAAATEAERRQLWRLVARSRLAQLDWDSSARLTDRQLERIVAILDEPAPPREARPHRAQ
jgi:hypothetical protein